MFQQFMMFSLYELFLQFYVTCLGYQLPVKLMITRDIHVCGPHDVETRQSNGDLVQITLKNWCKHNEEAHVYLVTSIT